MTSAPAAGTLISALPVGATIDAIADATAWLGAIADQEDWPAHMRFGLELSLEEALTNVVSYGFKGVDQAPEIVIECARMPEGRVAVRIIDNGIPFDPTTLKEPEVPASLEDAKIGGHGVQLMRHFLESMSHERAEGRNILTLVAKPGPAGA